MLQFFRRFLGWPSNGWPSRTPPTVPGPAPSFYCADCKHSVDAKAARCPACGSPTYGGI